MQTIRKINDELSISGQIALDQLSQIAQEFQSILNLRSSEESDFLAAEQHRAELAGLHYANVPFETDFVTDQAATTVLQQLSQLPKPVLVHCDNAIRAAAIALMYIATRQGATLEQAFKQAKQLGLFNVLTQPEVKNYKR